MATGISRIATRFCLPMAMIILALHLAGCGDKEAEQRKTFIDFLQNTVMRSEQNLPALSENQKQNMGNYAREYKVIYDFSQEMNKAIEEGVRPMTDTLSAIHTPQDYMTQRDALRQTSGALSILVQQMQNAKNQADASKAALAQPDDLKTVYGQVYSHWVTEPATSLLQLLPILQSLGQDASQAGDFLQQQGAQAGFSNNGVQFPTQNQATEYNTIMDSLTSKAQALHEARRLLQRDPH